jgi:hypothetical protein
MRACSPTRAEREKRATALSVHRARSIVAATLSRPGFAELSPRKRGWRAEKRKPFGVRVRCRTRQAPLGAPHARGSACYFAAIFAHHAGPRFRLGAACLGQPQRAFGLAAPARLRRAYDLNPRSAKSRSSRPAAGSATNKSSASSWQGLVVGTGGAPAPPGCRSAKPTRGRRASSRLTTPRDDAPSVDEVASR